MCSRHRRQPARPSSAIPRISCLDPYARAASVALPGGAQVSYPTAAFLALHPKNLSNGFRISATFGVDYRHQAVATTDIPARMLAKLRAGLPRLLEPAAPLDVQVRFATAAESSLDYAIWVDLPGTAAENAGFRTGLGRFNLWQDTRVFNCDRRS